MFRALLKELARQEIPKDTEVSFIFVENDAEVRIAGAVNEFRETLVARGIGNPRICVEPEPRLGIPFARNRMLEIALHFDLDYLAVLDDDDYPADEHWLGEIVKGVHTRCFDVAGGLCKIEPLEKEELLSLRFIPRIVYNSLADPDREKRAMARHRGENGKYILPGGSNVIYRLSFIRRHKIRFNDQLGFAHGEDLQISAEIKRAGGKTGWLPTALVYVRFREERLTLRSRFRLCRSACLVQYGKRYRELFFSKKSGSLRASFYAVGELALAFFRLLLVPVTGGRTLVGAARSFGRAVGCVEGLLGRESRVFIETDGY